MMINNFVIKVIILTYFYGIISWPYRASQIVIAGPIGPAIITSLTKIVLTLLKSYKNPPPDAYITMQPSLSNILDRSNTLQTAI